MGNVLVQEASLQAIANAIRYKNGTQNTYTPAQMAQAIREISGGGGSPTLITKTLTENGTFRAADDQADGYFAVTAAVHTGLLTPRVFDLDTGYVNAGIWKIGGDTVSYSDVYAVDANTPYLITLGPTVGSRFRVMFSTEDISLAEQDVTGSSVVNISNPAAYTLRTYTPEADGYIIVTKDNAGQSGIHTYMFNIQSLVAGHD